MVSTIALPRSKIPNESADNARGGERMSRPPDPEALALARLSYQADLYDCCTCGDPDDELPMCPACAAGDAWRKAYVAILDREAPITPDMSNAGE